MKLLSEQVLTILRTEAYRSSLEAGLEAAKSGKIPVLMILKGYLTLQTCYNGKILEVLAS